MVDCLSLLRAYNINRKEIVERDDYIIFDQSAFPRNTKTNYQIFKAGVDKTPKDYYTLETLLFLLKHASVIHAQYLPKANNAKIPPIRFPDRRSLLNYLNGEIDSAPGIDKNGPMDMPVPPPPLKRSSVTAGLDELPSRNRSEDRKKRPATNEHIVLKLIPEDQINKSDLGSTMPEGKINEIKTKRFLKKRTTIQAADDIGVGASHVGDTGFLDEEIDTARDIIKRERLLRNRSTILDSSGLTFTNILHILSQMKASEDGRVHDHPFAHKHPPTSQNAGRSSGRQDTYSRYDQEQQLTKDVSGFEIDTTGTYRIQKGTGPDSVKCAPLAGMVGKCDDDRQSSSKRESRTPIIIVPAALTAVITLLNAKEFLQDDRYIATSDANINAVGDILIQRRKVETGTSKFFTVPYRVIDSPAKLRPNDWNRVVAVFVAGPQWQFKGWPGLSIDGSPVEIFVKISAFHLKFLESPLEPNIKMWNVTILEISKTKRHLDKVAVNKFWEITDKSMVSKAANNKFKV